MYQAILSEFPYYRGGALGRYVMYNPGYSLSLGGTSIEAKMDWIQYNDDVYDGFSVSDGYKFGC